MDYQKIKPKIVDKGQEHLHYKQPIQIAIDNLYSFDQLTDIWTFTKNNQGTVIHSFLRENEIYFKCSGQQPKIEGKTYIQEIISYQDFIQAGKHCPFTMEFSIHKIDQKIQTVQEKIQKVQGMHKKEDFKLSNKRFKLQSVVFKHGQQCIASNPQFIFDRNFKFLQKNKIQIIRLINEKYQIHKSNNQIDKEVLKPNDYAEYISSFFGFNFLHYGFQYQPLKKIKSDKVKLKKKFDNIVKDARDTFEIPSSKKKYIKRAKPRYRLPSSSQNQKTKSNQKKQDQLKPFPSQLDDSQDSDYQICLKKRKRKKVKK